jgi:sugar phosphate isomerase/epimerase
MAAPIGLQLYTVRKVAEAEGYANTVKKVAAMGYVGVEPAGFPGSTAAEAAKLFRDLGLAVPSAHVALPIGENKNETLDVIKTLGSKRVISGLGPKDFTTLDLVKASCDKFNEACENCRAAGLMFGIHNHWWEFKPVDGRMIYRIMLERLNPNIFFEIDTYWVQTAGCNPTDVVRELGRRAPMLHIKDGPAVQQQPMTAAGEGVLDFPAIVGAAGNDLDWLVVELDECATDMMEAVHKSITFLVTKGLGYGKKS